MTNKEIYSRTLGFSVRRLLFDILAFLIMGALIVGGYYIAEKTADSGLVGLAIGAIVGIIAVVIMLRYISYTFKAGQIAMMTRAVTTGSLPDDVIGEGKKVVRERFATVALFFAATGIIKGIFNQLGRAITHLGKAVGGDTGETIGNVIDTAIQVVVAYLCDCCLGWVFYRREQNAARATCEGAVLFFKHGKTLAKNLGRVFGMGIASLAVIGGAFSGVFYLIASRFPAAFEMLAKEIVEFGASTEEKIPELLTNPATLMIVAAVAAGVILWSIIHSAFVRPFVLTGVLRNYLQSGMDDIPTEESFAMLDSKSAKFAKLHSELT
ncbi:MAG: hypothetical protein IJH09_10005 [Clostridia bacterium]|nr:hypothetical protein [Clostridia bacterium]